MHITVLHPIFLKERGNSINFLWPYPGWQRRCEGIDYILEIFLVRSKIVLVLSSEHFWDLPAEKSMRNCSAHWYVLELPLNVLINFIPLTPLCLWAFSSWALVEFFEICKRKGARTANYYCYRWKIAIIFSSFWIKAWITEYTLKFFSLSLTLKVHACIHKQLHKDKGMNWSLSKTSNFSCCVCLISLAFFV